MVEFVDATTRYFAVFGSQRLYHSTCVAHCRHGHVGYQPRRIGFNGGSYAI